MSIKNKIKLLILLILNFLIFNYEVNAEELDVSASEIIYDKNENILIANKSVIIIDSKGNRVLAEKAEYYKSTDQLITYGNSKIILVNGYKIDSGGVKYDNKNKVITSDEKANLTDLEGNFVSVDMFEYLIEKNLFSSRGNIKIIDVNKNKYYFEEMYIDTKSQKIVGSDIRVSINNENVIGLNEENDPRLVANSGFISEQKSSFSEGVFTTCKRRENNKCPPWKLQAREIRHDKAKKTIYYEKATLKIYDMPLFYFPKFFHPDPTVSRQSGFLIPFFTDRTTIGTGFAMPYYWAVSGDKDITFTPKFYTNHKSLFLTEYRQAFENGFLHLDTSYTQGYKTANEQRTSGSRNHIFGKFDWNFSKDPSYKSRFSINVEKVSNDTYFRIHDIDTELVDSNRTDLNTNIKYSYKKNDLYVNLSGSAYENLNESSNKRYEYILPNLEFGNLLYSSPEFGSLNFISNIYYNNYNVDVTNKYFINDVIWNSRKSINRTGFLNSLEAQIKNINYDSKNDTKLKENRNSEVSGVFAFKSKFPMIKEDQKYTKFFSPNFMLRLAPNHMRNFKDEDIGLSYSNLFSRNKTNVIDGGSSAILGFDFSLDEKTGEQKTKKLNASMGQSFSFEKNKNLPTKTSLDQRMSDVVGDVSYNFSDKNSIGYNFSLDNDLKQLNYNEISSNFSFGKIDFNLDYLEERRHIGNEKYVNTGITLNVNDSSSLSFKTKKNYQTESTEFYNLLYQYQNDCLAAGIEFNRTFYSDRDLEQSDTIMFKISILPFGGIVSPSLNRE